MRKQLQKVGTISYTHELNGEVSNDRGHSPLTLLKPSPSPRSLTPCSPARSQNRSSSRSPTVNSGTCSPIPRVEGRRGERSRSASASPIPPVTVEETSKLYPCSLAILVSSFCAVAYGGVGRCRMTKPPMPSLFVSPASGQKLEPGMAWERDSVNFLCLTCFIVC